MKIKPSQHHLMLVFVIAISAFYLAGLSSVPFHPDESTQIFMSSDFETFFTRPADLFWQADKIGDARQRYRELDAPLTRYLIGAGRLAAGGLAALPADWNWSQSWQDNLNAGAYPDPELLAAARLPMALLFPLSLILLFSAMRKIATAPAAWVAMLLFASHALVLLHTRRAMAESILLFTIILSLWSLVYLQRSLWWAAVPAGLAFCAKQSAGIMILPVLIAILWQPVLPIKQRLGQLVLAAALFGSVLFILNPFLWSSPVQALRSAFDSRAELVDQQVAMLTHQNPEKVLNSFTRRLAAQIGQIYFLEPAVKDVNNYAEELGPAEQAYQSNPIHRILRFPLGGALFMLFSLSGFLFACLQAIQHESARRALSLWVLANLLQMVALFLFVPLPIQRYSLPLIPFICIWSAYGLGKLLEGFLSFRKSRLKPAPAH